MIGFADEADVIWEESRMSPSSLARKERWVEWAVTEMERPGGAELAANNRLGNNKSSTLARGHLTCLLDTHQQMLSRQFRNKSTELGSEV